MSGICVPEAARRTLTVQLGGKGAGSITTEPTGLTCSADTCTGQFLVGASVKLSAAATTGSFLGWIDGCRGTDACEVAMDSDRGVGALFGERGEPLWVKQLGGTGIDYGNSIAMVSHGDVIAAGQFAETITPAPGIVLTSAGGLDTYVVKFSGATGNVIWAKRFGGAMGDVPTRVAVDSADEVYVTGHFRGTIDLGAGPKQVAEAGAFMLKLRPNGDYAWDKVFSADVFYTVELAVHDNAVVLASSVGRSMTIDGVPYTNPGGVSAFVIRMSPDTGQTNWVKVFGANPDTDIAVFDAAVDNDGAVVVVGELKGPHNFGPGTISGGDFGNAFLLKLAADGAYLFASSFGTNMGADRSTALVIDASNSIFMIGIFDYTVNFGCANQLTASTPNQQNAGDLFVAKYTPAGACDWVKGFGTALSDQYAHDAAVNGAGEIALVGRFSRSLGFGSQTLTSGGGSDVFAVRFNGDGTPLSSVRAGGTSQDEGFGTALHADGRFFTTGRFQGFAEFGGSTLTAIGASDAFVAAFAPL